MELTPSTISVFGFFLLHSILLFCISLPTSATSILGNETDRLALLAFKDRITNDPFQVMSSWNNSLHFCEWKGVTCSNRHERVSMLNLNSQGLVGSISPFIGNLSFLSMINLQNNSFHGEIPKEVGRLFRLQDLSISNNSFTGEIPVNLSYCSNLKTINFRYNELVGKIPTELGFLSKLVTLGLFTNKLTGGIPSSFGNLSSLIVLSLGQNNLEGSIPDSLGKLKSLKVLSLGPNMLSGIFPPSIYNLSYLQTVSITQNRLIGSFPPEIGLNFPNLFVFLIGGNNFSGSIPASLFNVSGLEMVEFSQNNFTGKVPIEVGSLKRLQLLKLQMNHLGFGKADDLNFLTSLTNCTKLQTLSIAANHFGGVLPNSIGNLSNQLTSLYLGGNQIFGSIPFEIENLRNLIVLGMDVNFFSGIIPKSIGMLQKLQGFYLKGNRFSGQIPSSLGNITQLYHLDLSNNILEGNIISDLGKCRFLKILDLSKNNLNGTIPQQVIGFSPQLTSINLANNSLIGSIPLEVGNIKNLEELDVSENKLSGKIPITLGSCLSLEYLYLQVNFFQGAIPLSFSSLKSIQELDLSRNNLSGVIPKVLQDIPSLQNLNLSFNDLEGEIPIEGLFQNVSAFSIVGNSKLCGGIPDLRLHACPVKKTRERGIPLVFKVTIGIIVSSTVLVICFLALYWRRKPRLLKSSSELSLGGDPYKRVSYDELHMATNGFAAANLIGVGNFGSVYKGVFKKYEMPIAVKVLNLMERGASKSFMAECNVLKKVRHRNLIKILTSCSSIDDKGNAFKALVFDFMPHGSLENWLHPSSDEQHLSRNLNLCQRLNIAIDVANALDYLHNSCQTPIVHCDLKPSNVLLDDDMTAVVGDFGIAKFLTKIASNAGKNDTSSVAIKGTIGYIPPEYGMGMELSTQGDVYSYGILLLEMFTTKRPTDDMFKDGLSLHHFCKMALTHERVMEIVDPLLLLEEDRECIINESKNQGYNTRHKMRECLISIIRIGVACSAESLAERMDISEVLVQLHITEKKLLEVDEDL